MTTFLKKAKEYVLLRKLNILYGIARNGITNKFFKSRNDELRLLYILTRICEGLAAPFTLIGFFNSTLKLATLFYRYNDLIICGGKEPLRLARPYLIIYLSA